jgi:hypothetical protein
MTHSVFTRISLGLVSAALVGCASVSVPPIPVVQPLVLTPQQHAAAAQAGVSEQVIATLLAKPLFALKPAELSPLLAFMQVAVPDLRQRVAALARMNIGQPYELYLLGEFPYEVYDAQPLYSLDKSDCVVFVEHIYAMALSASWEEFFWVLQRIRYKDGVIGVTTRNHYTEADWNPQNRWLLSDITATVAGPVALPYSQVINRARFFKDRYKLDRSFELQQWGDLYVPKQLAANNQLDLRSGDFVNVISGIEGAAWASHVGLIVRGGDGELRIVHSAEPQVREESLARFIQRYEEREVAADAAGKKRPKLLGFKFLRMQDAPEPPPMSPQPRPLRRDALPLTQQPTGPQSSNH